MWSKHLHPKITPDIIEDGDGTHLSENCAKKRHVEVSYRRGCTSSSSYVKSLDPTLIMRREIDKNGLDKLAGRSSKMLRGGV